MSKMQRSAELCISGAFTTTPTEALNVILHIPTLDLMIARSLALTTVVELKETVGWTQSHSDHSSILNKVDHIPSKMEASQKMIS